MTEVFRVLRLDSRGRVSLAKVIGELNLHGVSSFTVAIDPTTPGRLILDPLVEMADDDAVTDISKRDAHRLLDILQDDAPPTPKLVDAAGRFSSWNRRD